jgi:hypothetical protein
MGFISPKDHFKARIFGISAFVLKVRANASALRGTI